MKIYTLFGLSMIALFIMACGGGSSGSYIDIAEVIENKDFYRYIEADDKYYKEQFDGNGTLTKEIYLYPSNELNATVASSYSIDSTYVFITDEGVTVRCRIEKNNKSVTFSCLEEGVTGAAVETVRWYELDDALANPE